MAVLLANTMLSVRVRNDGAKDAHGTWVRGTWGAVSGPWPGRAREHGSDGAWSLAVDPAGWPLRAGDLVIEAGSLREWLVITADLLTNSEEPDVNYIRVDAHERKTGSTEPYGPEFAAR
jgi:hypothetical protein